MCEECACALGCRLIVRDHEIFAVHADASDERLPVDGASRHPWFDSWEVLKGHVTSDVHDRILRDAALGRF